MKYILRFLPLLLTLVISVESEAKNSISDAYLMGNSMMMSSEPPPANPAAPTKISSGDCGPIIVQRPAPPTGVTYYWQTSPSGQNAENDDLTKTVTSTQTIYLRAKWNDVNIWSDQSSNLSVTYKPIPDKPTVTSQSRCGPGVVSLVAMPPSSSPDATIKWYEGSSLKHTGEYYNPSLSSTKTYTVKAEKDGCSSDTTVTATIKPIPATPTGDDEFECGTTRPVQLNASTSASGAVIEWFNASNTKIYEGTSYATPPISLNNSISYTVKAKKDGCESDPHSITASVWETPAQPTGDDVSRCGSGPVDLHARSTTTGITIKWYNSSSMEYEGEDYLIPNLTATVNYDVVADKNGCESTVHSIT